ncbi:F-box domain-containing protein [Mycena venus]|uniref:F-box domain-containing protein n=1 Tax=Mycena venus TaxID=2733690 RepID=A0A8H6X324_9AGAR|nr:F-box domain-containing protein [Mycena venus]
MLPPELVSIIFLYCIPFSCQWDTPDANWRCPAPLVFLHVCRTWREIGLADASLWTAPHLRFGEYYLSKTATHQRTPAQIENFLASWVARARGRPLTLTIHGDMMRCLGNVRAGALLARYASQVKKLDLWLTGMLDWTNRGRSLPNLVRWPLLEEVEIMGADNFRDIAYAFSLAPKLRVLADNEGVLSPSFGTIPWRQLTSLHCKLTRLQDCVEVLQQAEMLEDCWFFLDDGDDDDRLDDEMDTVEHTRLRRLFLDGLNDGLDAVLPLLTLPALKILEVAELPTDLDSVLDFLERHASHLQELHMHQLLVKSLPPMPALTKLTLTTKKEVYTGDLFALLQSPERRFLPSLERIHLDRFHSKERGDYETMARALADRWHRSKGCADIAQLRSFTLLIKLGEDEAIEDFEELLSPVVDLKAAGVDIVVKYWGSKW